MYLFERLCLVKSPVIFIIGLYLHMMVEVGRVVPHIELSLLDMSGQAGRYDPRMTKNINLMTALDTLPKQQSYIPDK